MAAWRDARSASNQWSKAVPGDADAVEQLAPPAGAGLQDRLHGPGRQEAVHAQGVHGQSTRVEPHGEAVGGEQVVGVIVETLPQLEQRMAQRPLRLRLAAIAPEQSDQALAPSLAVGLQGKIGEEAERLPQARRAIGPVRPDQLRIPEKLQRKTARQHVHDRRLAFPAENVVSNETNRTITAKDHRSVRFQEFSLCCRENPQDADIFL